MRTPYIVISALAICLVPPCGQYATAQEATAVDDDCTLDPGAKASLLFERQCLNDSNQGRDVPLTSSKRRQGLSGQMDWKAGLIKDENDFKLLGFGAGIRMATSTSLSGQAGFGGAPYSPQGAVTFGFKFDF